MESETPITASTGHLAAPADPEAGTPAQKDLSWPALIVGLFRISPEQATTDTSLPPWYRTAIKLARYSFASVVAVLVSETALILCSGVIGLPGVASNLIAVTLGTIPSYLINRYWVWNKRTDNSLWTEVLPFWAMALAGLALSTLFVAYADHRWHTTLAVVLANLSVFGLLWVGKFLVLEMLLFGRHTQQAGGPKPPS